MKVHNAALILCIVPFFLTSSCSVLRKSVTGSENARFDYNVYCDTIEKENSIYFSRIDANVKYNSKDYDARISIYYLPDSVLIISVVNTGFELFRSAIYQDSAYIINRIDKLAYILESSDNNKSNPLSFQDIQLLFSNYKLCNSNFITSKDNVGIVNRSVEDIRKIIEINLNDFSRSKFDFFNKKSGEYIVGEQFGDDGFKIFGNFLIGKFEITASGGVRKNNEFKDINFYLNRSRYKVIHL